MLRSREALCAIGWVLLGGCDGGSGALDAGVDAEEPGPPMVVTSAGPVLGTERGEALAFYGIPYAAPPVGDLRFRAPEEPAPWTEPRDGTFPGAFCPQRDVSPPLDPRGTESEGCLELNVFTPDLAPAAPAPVIVFVHGGGFTIGAGNSELYEGASLAAAGAVVVTVNYRLGLAGFLAHPALDAEAGGSSGMYGILDQQAALRWVQENAAAFGGDPTRVLLVGESAGAISVCVHYFSPGSEGLFAAAISNSGSCAGGSTASLRPADGPGARARGVELATELGCPGTDAAAATCLRALPIDDLVMAIRIADGMGVADAYGILAIGPNVDGTVLPDRPEALIAAGEHAGVPYLMGTNRDEGTYFSEDAMITTPEELAAAFVIAEGENADAVSALYPAADYPSPLAIFDTAVRDLGFVCPTRALAQGLAGDGAPVFLYELNHTNAGALALDLGVMHGVDLLYVFGNTPLPFTRLDAAERNVMATMQGYWTRFAATGDPNGGDAVTWPVYDTSDAYLELADPPVERTGLGAEICAAVALAVP